MPNTNSSWTQSTAFKDGKMFLGVMDIFIQAGGGVLTRNAAGNNSIHQAASQSGLYVCQIANIMERVVASGLGRDLQEQFGTAAGVAGPSGVANTSDPAGMPAGRPPFTGSSQLSVNTGFIPKGMSITDVTVVFNTAGGALTSINIRVDKTTHVNAVALATSVVLANGANGLPTAASTNGQTVTKVAIAPGFNVTDNALLTIELAPVTPAAVTFDLYGFFLHYQFNLN